MDSTATVYNFTVEKNHTYYVGKSRLLVHNDCEKLSSLISRAGDKANEFVKDIGGNSSLLEKFYNGQYSVEAWLLVRNALGKTSQFGKDDLVLKQLAKMMDPNSNFRKALGTKWETELKDIIKTAEGAPCSTCAVTVGTAQGLPSLEKHLEYVEKLAPNLNKNTSANAYYDWARGRTAGSKDLLSSRYLEFASYVISLRTWVPNFPKLASLVSGWSHLELVFEGADDYVRVLSKGGDEIARVFKDGTEEIFEISDDFFKASSTIPATPITGVSVRANTGESIIGAGFFKNTDGSIGFVEDVSGYGSTLVQNAIKARGDLRHTILGITASQDAHHLFPVALLKKNPIVKKGIEGGFEFNLGSVNGIALEKYVKSTNTGRHGPHPYFTSQIDKHMEWWAEQTVNGVKNKDLTPTQTAAYMRGLANSLRNKIITSTGKLNELDLNLPHY